MLYIVSTPIGNLGDMTFRAVETLKSADFIAAEDTRVAAKLLSYFEIQKPVVSYYEHNREERGKEIVARLMNGESCALTTDAGTPCVSDPGSLLVRQCRDAGIRVVTVPGCCAAVAAFSLAGLDSGRFTFEGFLSMNKKNRREHLEGLKNEERPMIFYEAPHKLKSTLDDFKEYFTGERMLHIARELTKIHEESLTLSVSDAIGYYTLNDPRGEFVIIVEGKEKDAAPRDSKAAVEFANELINDGVSARDAAKRASELFGIGKNEIYKEIITERTI